MSKYLLKRKKELRKHVSLCFLPVFILRTQFIFGRKGTLNSLRPPEEDEDEDDEKEKGTRGEIKSTGVLYR